MTRSMTQPAGGAAGRPLSKSEVVRLGKRGSYRLGALAVQGIERAAPPRPFRPGFARPWHRGPVSAWVLAALGATLLIGAGSAAGLWFSPFVVGLVTGLVVRWGGWRLRVTVPGVAVMAALGWGLALWASALRGLPAGGTARAIAALAGLPPFAVAGIALTLAVGVVQGLAGLWLGRALAPRPARG